MNVALCFVGTPLQQYRQRVRLANYVESRSQDWQAHFTPDEWDMMCAEYPMVKLEIALYEAERLCVLQQEVTNTALRSLQQARRLVAAQAGTQDRTLVTPQAQQPVQSSPLVHDASQRSARDGRRAGRGRFTMGQRSHIDAGAHQDNDQDNKMQAGTPPNSSASPPGKDGKTQVPPAQGVKPDEKVEKKRKREEEEEEEEEEENGEGRKKRQA